MAKSLYVLLREYQWLFCMCVWVRRNNTKPSPTNTTRTKATTINQPYHCQHLHVEHTKFVGLDGCMFIASFSQFYLRGSPTPENNRNNFALTPRSNHYENAWHQEQGVESEAEVAGWLERLRNISLVVLTSIQNSVRSSGN